MLSLEEAVQKILAAVQPLPPRNLPLAEASGLTAAEIILSPIDLPPFDNSSMDGYAVRSDELTNADARPVTLRVAAHSPAGSVVAQSLEPATCIRIFTGSALPPGADAVVMQEDVQPAPGEPACVVISEKVRPWENIRFRGEDVKQGSELAEEHSTLTPQRLGLLAAAGIARVKVIPRPVLGLLSTGDELREPGQPLAPGQIFESNRVMLAALARRAGAEPRIFPLAPDDLNATTAALRHALDSCDALVTTGGVSVGERDFVKAAFAELGGQLDFWKVAVKPGKPFAFGQWNGKFLFGLPGNPVSAFVTFLMLVRPTLQKMLGSGQGLPSEPGTLAEPLVNEGSRRHFMRVTRQAEGATSLAGPQGSHLMLSLARANGLVDVPPNTTLPAGATVQVLGWWQAA